MPNVGKRHAIFIQEMVDQGETPEGQVRAYLKAYPNCKSLKAAKSASFRLLKNVTISRIVEQGLAEKKKLIDQTRKEQIQQIAKERLLSQAEVDAILCDIIQGAYITYARKPIFNPHKGIFEIVTVTERPTGTEVIAAIDKFNKRFGGYAAKKYIDETADRVIFPGE